MGFSVTDSLKSALGGVSSAGAGGLGSVLGGYASSKMQYRFNKKYALQGPSWQVQGLRKAGLNPILAVTGGSGGMASSPNATAAPMDFGSSAKNFSEASLKNHTKQVVKSQAVSSSAQAAIDTMRLAWAKKKFDFLDSPVALKYLLPISASVEAGYSPNSAKDAAIVSGVLSSTAPKSKPLSGTTRVDKKQPKNKTVKGRMRMPLPPRDSGPSRYRGGATGSW